MWYSLIVFTCVALLLFFSSLYFSKFNVDYPFYLSELVCSGPSRIQNCRPVSHNKLAFFLNHQDFVQTIPDYGVKYTSSSFARFLSIFISKNDSLNTVVFKVHIVKSLLGSYFLTLTFALAATIKSLRRLVLDLTLCTFAFPYMIFMISSVYPAPIATLGLLLSLVILRVLELERKPSIPLLFFLYVGFLSSVLVILANRVETTVFFGIALVLLVFRNRDFPEKLPRLSLFLATYLGLLGLFVSRNDALQSWFMRIVSNKVEVLNPQTVSSSIIASRVGGVGLSLASPVTLFDNTTRNLLGALSGTVALSWFAGVLLVIICWGPLMTFLFAKVILLAKDLVSSFRNRNLSLNKSLGGLVVVFLFVYIPFFAKTIWFFQYAAPLFLLFAFFVDSSTHPHRFQKVMLVAALTANFLILARVALVNGPINVSGSIIEPLWLLVVWTVLVALLVSATAKHICT